MSTDLDVLRRLRETTPRPPAAPQAIEERCELCTEPIGGEHGHLVDLEARNLLCSCRGCYLLFTSDGAGGNRYRAVPDEYRRLSGFEVTAAQWESLQIPVGVAFFFLNSSIGGVAAFYPGPAGATESELPLDTWEELVATHIELAELRSDVEALLVRADGRGGSVEGFIVPIDACYELVGRLRMSWRGFDGGTEARDHLDRFFASVAGRSR